MTARYYLRESSKHQTFYVVNQDITKGLLIELRWKDKEKEHLDGAIVETFSLDKCNMDTTSMKALIADSTSITEATFNKAKKVVVGYMNFSQQ